MCRGSEADAASRNARVEFGVGQQPLESAILLLEILQPLGQSQSGGHRTASSFHEYVCSVTPIFLTAIGNGLASPHLDFDSRSLWMASSFFPRGMECPPLVLTPPDSLSGSGAALWGAGLRGDLISEYKPSGRPSIDHHDRLVVHSWRRIDGQTK